MKPYIFIFSLLIPLLLTPSAGATTLLPISLEQLSTRAALIFYATVTSNQVKKDEQSGQIATITEFQIIEVIKGNAAAKHTIKQLGGKLKNKNTNLRIHGIPEFTEGQSYVVFLPKKSKHGFSSPLGLQQGSFAVSTVNGEKMISNGHRMAYQNKRGMHPVEIPLAVNDKNPVLSRLDDFVNTVRAFNLP